MQNNNNVIPSMKVSKSSSKKNLRPSNYCAHVYHKATKPQIDNWPEWKQRAAIANYKFGE